MLKLTSYEVSSLRSDELKRIKKNVTEYYLNNSSKYIKNETTQEFSDNIKLGLKRASRYGLNTEYSLIKYLELMFTISNKFDEQTDIRRMLAEEEKTANTKIDTVYKKLNLT